MFPVLLSVLCLVCLKQGKAAVVLLLEPSWGPALPWTFDDRDLVSRCRAILRHLAMGQALVLRINFATPCPVGCRWFGVRQAVPKGVHASPAGAAVGCQAFPGPQQGRLGGSG